mgnify:CR=1 FL=1
MLNLPMLGDEDKVLAEPTTENLMNLRKNLPSKKDVNVKIKT